eukprot:1140573-Pelagomonas_calceolata.AAC.2
MGMKLASKFDGTVMVRSKLFELIKVKQTEQPNYLAEVHMSLLSIQLVRLSHAVSYAGPLWGPCRQMYAPARVKFKSQGVCMQKKARFVFQHVLALVKMQIPRDRKGLGRQKIQRKCNPMHMTPREGKKALRQPHRPRA